MIATLRHAATLLVPAAGAALSCWIPATAGAQAEPRIDSVYLVAARRGADAWYVNQYVRGAFEVRLARVPDERSCRRRVVLFIATQGAAAGKDALTFPERRVTGEWADTVVHGSQCRAMINWRLGDVPGSHELVAVLQRDTLASFTPRDSSERTVIRWRTSAHLPATLVAGFSYAIGPIEAPSDPDDEVFARRGQPFFGIEFVPLVEAVRSGDAAKFLERIRITLGTSYREPGYDFYAGLSPIALLDGLRSTGFSIQLTAGHRWSAEGSDTWFVAGTVNALSLFSTILGKL